MGICLPPKEQMLSRLKEAMTDSRYIATSKLSDEQIGDIYHEVIKSYFDDLDVVLITSLDEIQDTNALFITVTKQSGFNKIKLDSLTNLISIGNDVMFVGEYLPYQFEVDFGYNLNEESMAFDSLSLVTTEGDTVLHFNKVNEELENKKSWLSNFYTLSFGDDSIVNPITYIEDGKFISFQLEKDKGSLLFHYVPDIFRNIGFRNRAMFEYHQYLLSQFDPDKVYIINGKYYDYVEDINPLQFVLAHRSLKTAYFLLLFIVLIFILFEGKRKQKAIPLVPKNENTSLEYIDTLSRLYLHQNQHNKLLKYMEDNFYHTIEHWYYIKPDEEYYMEKLAKKSKIPIVKLESLVKHFKYKGREITANRLADIERQLDDIYKLIRNNRK